MEEKSIGLVVGSDGAVFSKTPLTEGMFSRPMARDPSGPDMGPSMANSTRFNERFRAGDLSVRTGEEFAMAFSPFNGGGRAEGKSVKYWMPAGRNAQVVEGDGNQGYGHDGGLMGTGVQMAPGNSNSDVSERGNFSAGFGADYHGAYSEAPRAAQGFNPGIDGDFQFDEGSIRQTEWNHPLATTASDDVGGSSKVKFMCSFGGKILPRPSDGSLRYVGGETRIVTVNKGIGFSELRLKMMEIYGQALLFKYQLPNEELDALVSVSCDEDLENMMDEYERHLENSGEGSSRLRLFLFSASDSDLAHLASMDDRRFSEQRYVDAVNGITEAGFRKPGHSSTGASSQNLENLIGLDSVDNLNLMLPDHGGMPGPLSSKIMTPDVASSGTPPTRSPVSSKQGIAKGPSLTSPTSSSPMLSSVPTHFKQSGLGDSSVVIFPEQQVNISGHPYSPFRQPDGGVSYHDMDYRGPVPSAAVIQNETHLKTAGSRREPDSSIHKRADRQQGKFDASHPMADPRSDGLLPPLDPRHTVLQQPTPPVYWQHHVDSHPDAHRFIQHINVDGGHAQQPFQQHAYQGAHLNNPWPRIHEGRIYRSDQEQQQQQDDLFGGSYPDKPVSTHLQPLIVSTAASPQPISAPQSPQLVGHQIALSQQQLQMHYPVNAPFSEQLSYGTRMHYYDPSIRTLHHPMSLPSQYQGQRYEQYIRQQALPHDQLSHPEEQLIQQHAVPHVHSDNALQKHVMKPVNAMYEGVPIAQGHHPNGSLRPPSSNVRENLLQEGVMFSRDHQDIIDRRHPMGIVGKEFQPMISGQQTHTITRGGMEYVVQKPPPPCIDKTQDKANYVLHQRMVELNSATASRGRMTQSEAKQEQKSAEFSGSHLAEPAVTSTGIIFSENPYGLPGSGLNDSYDTYQQSEKFETFEPTSYQFMKAISTRDAGTVGILRDPLQETRMIDVAVPSSVINVQEERVENSLREPTVADQISSADSLLSGVNQQFIEQRFTEVTLNSYVPNTEVEPCSSSEMSTTWWNGKSDADCSKVDMSHIDFKKPGVLGEHHSQEGSSLAGKSEIKGIGDIPDTTAQNESHSNLISLDEQHPGQSPSERATADISGLLSFTLPDDISDTRSSNKTKELIPNPGHVRMPESSSLQYATQVQAKKIVDDDNGHSVVDIQSNIVVDVRSNTSSLDKVKDRGDSYSEAGTLAVVKSEYDSAMDYLKDISISNVATSKVPESSSYTQPVATSNMPASSNISVSTNLLENEATYREEDSIKDVFSVGLSSPALHSSDVKVEDEHARGEVKNVTEDVASIQPPLCNSPTLSLHAWDHATEDGNAQGNASQTKLLKQTEDEVTANSDSIPEESKTIESDMDEPAGVIKAASELGLQTIKNADLEELRELGSGTFGTVYHGKWRGTDVAIKRIKNSCFMGMPSEQDRLRADFWREANMLAKLHHPNVVAFYGVVPDGPGGTLATVTEYMANGSLKQVLQRKDRVFDQRKRLIISMDAAFGMEYLHGKNIVHFDLKCDNLLVNMRDPQRPVCKVGDLGLSKIKHQTLVSGGVRGTLPWMAPELLNGSSNMVNEKVDVFSFGIVMWELLTGEEPYANMHYGAIIGGIVNNTLRPPIPSSCSPAWRLLMERCWSADPSVRPTFTEITNRLRAMAASLRPKGQGPHVQSHPQN